jgi:hypothetical protein
VRGHHWRVKRLADGVPDEKVCEHCAKTYQRTDIGSRQSNIHWLERRFCTDDCRRQAAEVDRTVARVCGKCGVLREPQDFYKGRSDCRECHRKSKKPLDPAEARRRNLWNAYKITPEQYDAMLNAQGGVCA